MLALQIDFLKLRKNLGIAVGMSIMLLFTTVAAHYAYYSGSIKQNALLYFTGLFNLSNENTIATWFSSMLLLCAALMALICYYTDRHNTNAPVFRHGWLLVSFVFGLMSLDEMGSLHENAGKLEALDIMGDGGWESVIAVPLLLVLFYMVLFAWFYLRTNTGALALFFIGALLFLSVPVQEYFEMQMWHEASYSKAWQRPIQFVLMEEGAELSATLCFCGAMTSYLLGKGNSIFVALPNDARVRITTMVILSTLAAVAFILYFLRKDLNADEGIALNWFPSAINFVLMLVILRWSKKVSRIVPLAFIVASVYMGINFYQVISWGDLARARLLITLTLLVIFMLSTYSLVSVSDHVLVSASMITWAIILTLSLFIPHLVMAFAVFVVSVLFMSAFLAFNRTEKKNPPGNLPEGFVKA